MTKDAFLEAARKNNIYGNDEANDAIEFVLDLLYAEKQHLEATEPAAYASISRLEAAWSELSCIASDLEDFME